MTYSSESTKIDEKTFREYCRKRMSKQEEFIKLFYEVLYMAALEGKEITHQQAFDLLNSFYFNLTGELRYKDYLTFCINRIRKERIVVRNNPRWQKSNIN